MNHYERETVEFQPVIVTVNAVVVTTGVELCVKPAGDRPADWAAATVLEDQIGFMVDGLAPGQCSVWARIASNPEIPVIQCGDIYID